jgi:hypothetical protein
LVIIILTSISFGYSLFQWEALALLLIGISINQMRSLPDLISYKINNITCYIAATMSCQVCRSKSKCQSKNNYQAYTMAWKGYDCLYPTSPMPGSCGTGCNCCGVDFIMTTDKYLTIEAQHPNLFPYLKETYKQKWHKGSQCRIVRIVLKIIASYRSSKRCPPSI